MDQTKSNYEKLFKSLFILSSRIFNPQGIPLMKVKMLKKERTQISKQITEAKRAEKKENKLNYLYLKQLEEAYKIKMEKLEGKRPKKKRTLKQPEPSIGFKRSTKKIFASY